MRLLSMVLATILAITSSASLAEITRTTASNGVIVNMDIDSFANEYSYSSPSVNIDPTTYAFVLRSDGRVTIPSLISGASVYRSSHWRFYNSAIIRGGTQVTFVSTLREVQSCSSRMGDCLYVEGFRIRMTPAQLAQATSNGMVEVQLRAQNGPTLFYRIPVSHFEAVNEVANRR